MYIVQLSSTSIIFFIRRGIKFAHRHAKQQADDTLSVNPYSCTITSNNVINTIIKLKRENNMFRILQYHTSLVLGSSWLNLPNNDNRNS